MNLDGDITVDGVRRSVYIVVTGGGESRSFRKRLKSVTLWDPFLGGFKTSI